MIFIYVNSVITIVIYKVARKNSIYFYVVINISAVIVIEWTNNN